MRRLCASAVRFTADCCNSILRPAGRSGCVSTSGISCPRVSRASSVGTAKSGVPQKTSLTGVTSAASPLPVLLELANAPLHEVALQRAYAVDEEYAIEVIDLVLYGA